MAFAVDKFTTLFPEIRVAEVTLSRLSNEKLFAVLLSVTVLGFDISPIPIANTMIIETTATQIFGFL